MQEPGCLSVGPFLVRLFGLVAFLLVLPAVLADTATPDGAVRLTGPMTQGALVTGEVPAGSEVTLNGRAIRVTPAGRFALGFGREAPRQQALRVRLPDGREHRQTLSLTQREYNVQRVDGVPSETVNPPAERLQRIRREARKVAQARQTDSDLNGFAGGFIWPAQGRISGVYGSQRIYNGEPRSPHYGIDIAAPRGAPVLAPAPGRVTMAEPDLFYSGGTLIIDHGYGVSSTFLHLDSMAVAIGDKVEQGEVVARVGSSGRSTGPHLDWRINWFDQRLDPATVVPAAENGRTPPEAGRDEDRSGQQ